MVLRNGSTLSVDVSAAGEADEDQQPGTSQPIRVSELDQFDEEWLKPFPLKDGVRIRKEKFSDYYTLFEEIGEGKFGKVYRCEEKATGLILAAKCIKIRKDTDFEKVEKEVNIMTQMRHKCIAQIYDAFATEANDVILIMEMVQGGELFDRIADDSYILTEMAVALIMFQICEAIRYIHSQNIIHLDLKPENIMCVSQISNKIKLIDFGLAQWYDGSKDLMFMAGTPEFAAPEVIKYEPLDFHTDMWSLGVIAYILLSGQSPFLGETLAHTYCNVEKGRWRFCEEFTENGISDEAKDFISRLLIVHKEERMLPAQCLVHPWIQKNRQRALENASRAVSPAVCQPLAIEKLRSYVKNKKFRRLVFGVLFVNSVLKMLQTLQRNKSTHGIEYVRNMLAAAENQQQSGEAESSNLLLKAFTKKKQKLVALAVGIAESNQPNEVIEEKVINKKDMAEEQKMDLDKPAEKAVETRKRVVIVKKVREPGEKKKRSKSEARRAAEQQRTRSSTEHTSNKKQRQEAEEKMELEEKKKERRKSPEKEKKLLIIPREEEKKPVEVVEKPMMRIIKMEVEERQKQREADKERQRREDRERLAQFRLEADERRKAEQKEKEKPTARVGQVQKLAQRMELFEAKQKPAETQAPAAAMASTSAAPAKPANAATNSLVSNMLKRLEQQKGQGGPAPLAFAVSATAPRREEPSKKEEKREEKVEGKRTEKKEEKRTEKRAEEKRREPKKEWKEEEKGKGKEELISWREEIRRREQQQAADKQRGDEKKKQVKMVKRKVVRRVRTAEEEMQQVRTMKMECNGKDKRKVPEEKGMEERMEVDDNCWVSVVVVERTRERLRREAEDQQHKGQQQQQQQQATPMVGWRKEAQINGTEQKLKVNGHQQQPLRLKPRLKVSNSLEEMARTAAHDDAGWAMVGQDVFDFSLLRMKLQNRIMGLKDNDELTTEAENRQKFELQKQKRELQTNLNIKRAMRKWLTMDKESRTTGQQGRGEPIPEWAR